MPRRFIDLSVALEAEIASDPDVMLPEIEYMSHADTASQVMAFFPGLTQDDLPAPLRQPLKKFPLPLFRKLYLQGAYWFYGLKDR